MITRPSRVHILLEVASTIAQRGTCARAQVGAVLAKDGRIISTGYNGPPSRQPHCSPEYCDVAQSCTRSVHAEANAVAFAARQGISTDGCEAYLQLSPCVECAKLLINAGVIVVFYREEYRQTNGLDLLRDSGVQCFHVPPLGYASDADLLAIRQLHSQRSLP